jgi:2-polyprenyl-6-methoxyphenol hydroxylase and related FAD-dependent oxidoreductases
LTLDDAAFAARLEAASQGRLGAVEAVGRRLSFPLRALHAERYHAAHLVLLGDAAHGIHPLAGQGLNLGFGDVAELAAQLQAARDRGADWAGPRVLARYDRARQAANMEMLALTDALYRSFGWRLPGWQQLMGAGLSLVAAAPPLRGWFARRAVR